MDHSEPLDLRLQLPRDVYCQLVHNLRTALPPPIPNTPEAETLRENAAMADVASMLPANAHEVALAAQFVIATARANDCERQANECAADIPRALQCAAQSANMMRQARGAISLLLRVQAVRHKREADGVALEKANWIEHCAIGLMANALGCPHPAAEPPPPQPAPEPEPAPKPEPENDFAALPEADQYAVIYAAPQGARKARSAISTSSRSLRPSRTLCRVCGYLTALSVATASPRHTARRAGIHAFALISIASRRCGASTRYDAQGRHAPQTLTPGPIASKLPPTLYLPTARVRICG
jgi:hypothetical protein